MQRITSKTLILLVIFLTGFVVINGQGWTFTFAIATSGPCGASLPVLPTFTIPYMSNQSFCESLRQNILNIRVSGSVYGDHGEYLGECAVFYTCTACTGSDIAVPSDNSLPGTVAIDGLTKGTAFFSPHESKTIQNWIDDYNQKMESMGITAGMKNADIVPDVPATGDADFDKFYADQTIRFEKPEQGGVVDLTGKTGVVDLNQNTDAADLKFPVDVPDKTVPIMGSAPLTVEELERINAYNLKSIPDNRLDESNFKLEESPFWTTPEMIQLGTDAAKFSLGFISGGYVVVAGAEIISGVLNKKSGQEILIDVAGSLLTKKAGDIAGAAIGKGSLSIGKLELKTGALAGAEAKDNFELVSTSGQALIDAWGASKINSK
ncbi:MAG: hypothetical protein WAL29_07710 [Bacteroidales bacterium]